MRERLYFFLVILFVSLQGAIAQTPVIEKIEPLTSFPISKILITGSGFSSTKSQLQVWFDQVTGNIISSSDFSIEVEVPAQARLANVTVLNLASHLSAKSKLKLIPAFSGVGFDPTKLEAPISITTTNAIFEIISADVDGDNKPDLIGTKNETTSTTLGILMNQSTVGNISFPTAIALNINAPTGYLAAGDLNGDGKADLVTSRDGTTANTVFVLANTSTIGNPSFASPVVLTLDIAQGVREVGIADLNGDGKPEIVVTNSATNNLYVFMNQSTGGILNINLTPVKIAVTGATKTGALELQDMDRDGKIDIVAASYRDANIYILRNTSSLSSITFSSATTVSVPGTLNDLATADLNGDDNLDIITTSIFTNQAQVLLRSSGNSFAFDPPLTLATDAQPFGIDVSDLNGDDFPDFIIPCLGTNLLNAYINKGIIAPGEFTKVNITTSKAKNWFVRAGDLDGDAKPDIAFTSLAAATGPFSVEILRNKNCHKPEIQNVAPLFVCPAQTIRLMTIPIPGVTFDWSNGFNSIKNSVDPFADITAAATYTVTAIGEGTACSVVSAPLIVQSGAGTLPADPAITTNAPICVGTTLTLSTPVVSGATYAWTGPNNFTSTIFNPTISSTTSANAGIYSLTIKVGDCSSNTITKRVDIVTFGSFAVTSPSASNSICAGQTLTLSVNSEAGYSYQWMKDGTNISGQTSTTLSVSTEGSYKVKVTNTALGCSQETNAVAVVAFVVPVANFTLDAKACVGTLVTFVNSSIVDSRVPAASIVYAWDFGDNTTSNLEDPTHTYATVQTVTPKLTVSYASITGCTGTLSKTINVVTGSTPTISFTSGELCANGSEKSTLTALGLFNSYLWSTSETTSFIDVTTPAVYTVDTVDPNGCKSSASTTIVEKTTNCEPVSVVTPPVFTPNGDLQNDLWVIPGIENKGECTMNIFDGRGRKVLEKKGFPIGGWDGVSDEGKPVPDGTYYYVLSCPDESPTTGSVLIVR